MNNDILATFFVNLSARPNKKKDKQNTACPFQYELNGITLFV